MAETPNRAVRLTPVGETATVQEIASEGVAAYDTIQKVTTVVRLVQTGQARLVYSRNAMLEASARIFAKNNFR